MDKLQFTSTKLSRTVKSLAYKAFSSVDWQFMLKFFSMQSYHQNILFVKRPAAQASTSSSPQPRQRSLALPSDLINQFKKRHVETVKTHGPSELMSDASRTVLVNNLLQPLVLLLFPLVTINMDFSFGTEQACGPVELVFLSSHTILSILERKAPVMLQGKAQLAMVLHGLLFRFSLCYTRIFPTISLF
eukprot:TRINITY_DN10614_c0_g1_i1.p1 TRINITY_DN10614_c0_g1~~TRINITY_DN10614_c0_g1_i1.p1  ORF type:complete len:189 (+),score=30.00 TRINITY_DN10614_c0_g1_i1:245-811(+)